MLATGRPAVTASKQLVVWRGPELTKLATRNHTRLYCSAAVGGAAPMIGTLERALQEGAIRRLRGVLNGTCNFVLDQLARGIAFDTAISEACRRGYTETNAARDLSGEDSAGKLRILARLTFGAESDTVPISRESLTSVEVGRIGIGKSSGIVIRHVATFDPTQGASIRLELLPTQDYLAAAEGEESRLIISGTENREWRVSGKGAGRWPTAEAMIADLLDMHAHVIATTAPASRQPPNPPPTRPDESQTRRPRPQFS